MIASINVVYIQVTVMLVGGLLTGCRPNEENRYYHTGQLKSRVALDDKGLYNGYCQNFDTDGALKSKLQFQHGEIEGVAYYYYPTGKLWAYTPYRHSKLNGLTRYFYANGKVKRIKEYRNDVEVGTSLHYYSSGRLHGRVQHDHSGKVVEFDFYTPSGKRDMSYTKALVLAAFDTISSSQSYTFDVVLANSLSDAVTVRINSPDNNLDSLPAPLEKHRYVTVHPHPGANRLRGRVYNRVLRHDTLYKYWFEIQHTFWVRSAKANK